MPIIDVSLWFDAKTMPVVIDSLLGYRTESTSIRGGKRRYHWVKIGSVGVEVTVTTPLGAT